MISIVMPTYNRATTLPRAVGSVMQQSFSDWELIIVDDGSTDDTDQFLATIKDPRVIVCRHPENRGVTSAKNAGLDHIRGDWFTLLDSDDEMTPDALETMNACVERTGATAITCNCSDSETGEMTGIGPTSDGWMSEAEAGKCQGEHWGMTKTTLLGDLRFDERLPGFEGTLWLKINHTARRYYLHRALRVYHTEGADRVTVASEKVGVRSKVRNFFILGEDRVYLAALKSVDPGAYRRIMVRVWCARLLGLTVFRSEHR